MNNGVSVASAAVTGGSMATVSSVMPSALVDSCASSMLAWLVNREGSRTPRTRVGPSASTATAAVSAESMPPERPSTTPEKLFFPT